jgi:hypothetical protein
MARGSGLAHTNCSPALILMRNGSAYFSQHRESGRSCSHHVLRIRLFSEAPSTR